jgi:hypothetical protein
MHVHQSFVMAGNSRPHLKFPYFSHWQEPPLIGMDDQIATIELERLNSRWNRSSWSYKTLMHVHQSFVATLQAGTHPNVRAPAPESAAACRQG